MQFTFWHNFLMRFLSSLNYLNFIFYPILNMKKEIRILSKFFMVQIKFCYCSYLFFGKQAEKIYRQHTMCPVRDKICTGYKNPTKKRFVFTHNRFLLSTPKCTVPSSCFGFIARRASGMWYSPACCVTNCARSQLLICGAICLIPLKDNATLIGVHLV